MFKTYSATLEYVTDAPKQSSARVAEVSAPVPTIKAGNSLLLDALVLLEAFSRRDFTIRKARPAKKKKGV